MDIQTKVVFIKGMILPWKFTPDELVGSVDMDKIFLPAYGFPLPKRYRLMDSNVSPNVDVFHLLAFAGTAVVDDIKVLKGSANIIYEIHAVSWKTARRTPVSGVLLQGSHS